MRGQRWQKVACVEKKYLALLQRNGISRTFLAVERGDLTENLALSDIVQHDLFATYVGVGEFDPSTDCKQLAVAWISPSVNDSALGKAFDLTLADEGVERRRGKATQKSTVRQKAMYAAQIKRRRWHDRSPVL